jgi:type IV pilus assembly protein PilX
MNMSPTPRRRRNAIAAPQRQRGAILVIALMFLVLLTIISVSSISGVTLEEKMAGNMREQNVAFQAAESALRDAEIDLETGIGGTGNRDPMTIAASFANNCSGAFTFGVCLQPAAPPATWQAQIVTPSTWDWTNANKTTAYGTFTGAAALVGVVRQPRYVVEYLQEKDDTSTTPATRFFRISARGWGANANTTVTLQTVYRMQMN